MFKLIIGIQYVWFFLNHLNVTINPNVQKIDQTYAYEMISKNQHLAIFYVLLQYWGREIISAILMYEFYVYTSFDEILAIYTVVYHTWKIQNLAYSCIHKRSGKNDVLYLLVERLFKKGDMFKSIIRLSISMFDTLIQLRFIYVMFHNSYYMIFSGVLFTIIWLYQQIDININKRSPAVWIVELVRNFVFHPSLFSGRMKNIDFESSDIEKSLQNISNMQSRVVCVDLSDVSNFIRYCLRLDPSFVPFFTIPFISVYSLFFWLTTFIKNEPLIIEKLDGVELWGFTRYYGSRVQYSLTFGHRYDAKIFDKFESESYFNAFISHLKWCRDNNKKNIFIHGMRHDWVSRVQNIINDINISCTSRLNCDMFFNFVDDTMCDYKNENVCSFSLCKHDNVEFKRLFRYSNGFYCVSILENLLNKKFTALLPDEQPVDVVIIGAGFSGIMMAMCLKNMGVKNIIIVEKNDTAGGLWAHQNEYVKLTTRFQDTKFGKCFPSFSSKINPYPTRKEITMMLHDMIKVNNIDVMYNCEIKSVGINNVILMNEQVINCKYVVNCTGVFHERKNDTALSDIVKTCNKRILIKGDGNTAFEECGIIHEKCPSNEITMIFKHYPIVLPLNIKLANITIPVEKLASFSCYTPTYVLHFFTMFVTKTYLLINRLRFKINMNRHHIVIDKYNIHALINSGKIKVVTTLDIFDENNFDFVLNCCGYSNNDSLRFDEKIPDGQIFHVGKSPVEPVFPLNSIFDETYKISKIISATICNSQ